ncbi:SLC2A4 regulator [Rhineura floridana]|uniref:SLC2A4 regulator n=1 Tax=Rhineura floridana TaxID=261503 RepID=UPI002AC7E6DA|nr:SLC2A4 regulator [Rhineura floridana]
METKPRLFKRSASPGGGRICSPPPGLTSAGHCCPDSSPPAAGLYCGVVSAGKPLSPSSATASSNAVYTVLVEDPASLRRRSRRRSCEEGAGKSPPAGTKGRLQLLQKRPTHCNGKAFPGEAELINGWPRQLSDPAVLKQPEEGAAGLRLPEQTHLHQSAHIPVPRQRKLSEKAGPDEVIAAAVLTSLSTSPVVLNNPPNGFCSETNGDVWKEVPAMSSSCSSSNNSGDWRWDPPSDLSTPSTPSPPLSTDAAPSFLSSLQSDLEETEATHFLFGDPIPRKRKVIFVTSVLLSVGLSDADSPSVASSRREADLDQSDGEEDFYYTELDVNVDSLTDGLSSLTPVSPTSSVPPAFPTPEEVQQTPGVPFSPDPSTVSHLSQSPHVTILSQSAPTSLCHIQTDHAYQATGPAGVLADLKVPSTGMEISISWQQPTLFPPPLPPVLYKSPLGCLTPIRSADVGEKRPQVPPAAIAKGQPLVPSSMPKPSTGTRKPRGEAKKCRKVYGMENRNMWCTACRWKKACQRFVD